MTDTPGNGTPMETWNEQNSQYVYDFNLKCSFSHGPVFQTGFEQELFKTTVQEAVLSVCRRFPEVLFQIVAQYTGHGEYRVVFGDSFVALLRYWDGRICYFGSSAFDRRQLLNAGCDHAFLESNGEYLLAVKASVAAGTAAKDCVSAGCITATNPVEPSGFPTDRTRVQAVIPVHGSFVLVSDFEGSFHDHRNGGNRLQKVWFAWSNRLELLFQHSVQPHAFTSPIQEALAQGRDCSFLLSDGTVAVWPSDHVRPNHQWESETKSECRFNLVGGSLISNVDAPAVSVTASKKALAVVLKSGRVVLLGCSRCGGKEPEGAAQNGQRFEAVNARRVFPVVFDVYGTCGFGAEVVDPSSGGTTLLFWKSYWDTESESDRVQWIDVDSGLLGDIHQKLAAGVELVDVVSNMYGTFALFRDRSVLPVSEHGLIFWQRNRASASAVSQTPPALEVAAASGAGEGPATEDVVYKRNDWQEAKSDRPSTPPSSSRLLCRPFSCVRRHIDEGGGVRQLVQTQRAFCALLENGSAVSWGVRTFGGGRSRDDNLPCISSGDLFLAADHKTQSLQPKSSKPKTCGTVSRVAATSSSFAAVLGEGGTVVTWGKYFSNDRFGVLGVGVEQVWGGEDTFAAQLRDGRMAIWGDLGAIFIDQFQFSNDF